VEDLKAGRVRTPLDPRTTFEDDPLRVLRCIRFASRLAFVIDEDIAAAAKEPSIQVFSQCALAISTLIIVVNAGDKNQ
jgi:tRNA nucleotidyltransferase (CCA-adding enzyme)